MKYIMTEKQNTQSDREGVQIEAKTLTAAKRIATYNQVFSGTVLVLETIEGNTVAVKESNKKWVEQSYFNA